MGWFEPFVSEAPGRVCLLGEHQDYLGLPVMAAAIPLRCRMVVSPRMDGMWQVETPDLKFAWRSDEPWSAPHDGEWNVRDFLHAGLAHAHAQGWKVTSGGDVLCHVDIPLQSGCSSSTAMVVAWVQALAHASGQTLAPMELARHAHEVEVGRFGAPGGFMDHVAIACGGVLRIHPGWRVESLEAGHQGAWVLVDSGEPKNTFGHLRRCKSSRLELLDRAGGGWRPLEDVASTETWTDEELALWRATWRNVTLEEEAAASWGRKGGEHVAQLMGSHHHVLRDALGLSTPTLERLGHAAMAAGAWGWKVVGSGGGGCALVWCPRSRADDVHSALRDAGANASWTVAPSDGAVCRPWKQPNHPLVVLAAGRSSRMRDESSLDLAGLGEEATSLLRQVPKAMLPVNDQGKPFLALILEQAQAEGVDSVCVVLSAEDDTSEAELRRWTPRGLVLDVARQGTPGGRTKPEGTAAAVAVALAAHPEWSGIHVSVCNGDNKPPAGAFRALAREGRGMVVFDRDSLGLPKERVMAFAVVEWSKDAGLVAMMEKPNAQDVERVKDGQGKVWVSMNVFRWERDHLLHACLNTPMHPVRHEREIPTALMLASTEATFPCIPMEGAFVDLTHPGDWKAFQTGWA